MKSTIKNLLTFSLLALVISSCGKKKTVNVLIPEDAAIVFHVNAASLGTKLTWNEIKNSEWFKMAAKEGPSGDFEKKMFEDPENSGIDLKSDMYLFIQKSGSDAYLVTQGKVKDATAFETTVKKMAEDREIKKDGSLNYAGDEKGCISWNTDRFIAVFYDENFQGSGTRFGGRTRSNITADSIFNHAKELYSLKKSNSLGNDSRFASIMNEKGDMHFWLNPGSLIKGSIPKDLGGLFNATTLLEGNITGYTLNFDNGKITASSKSWFGKELTALIKKYRPGNIDADMLKRIPGQNVSLVIAMNYPPEGLKEFLKLLGVDGILNGVVGMLGISIDDFIKANKGDLLFAASDFSVQDKTKSYDFSDSQPTYTKSEPDAKILFATSINDKPSFDKLVDILKKVIGKERQTEELDKIKYTVKDNWFIAGNAQESIDGFAAGKKTDHAFISKISGHPIGAYIDLQKILGSIQTREAENYKNVLSGDSKIWDNIIFYGGEMKDGATTGYFEINMIDKNTNSLKQLNNFITTLAKTVKNAKDSGMSDRDNPAIDTIMTLPVVK